MRINVAQNDPGYETFVRYGADSHNLEVWFEGAKLDNCVTADTEEGTVLVLEERDKGFITHHAENRTYRGHVKIMLNGAVLASSPIPQTEAEGADAFITVGELREWNPGDSPVLPPIDETTKTALAAIRIKASEPLPSPPTCIHCGSLDGDDCDCMLLPETIATATQKLAEVFSDFLQQTLRIRYDADRDAYEDLDMPGVYFSGDDLKKAMERKGFGGGLFSDATKEALRSGMFGRFASGGLVGERGPEPIMPIKRALTLPAAAKSVATAARRARARKPKPFTEHDEGVHRAISAMQSATTNRKANDL